jgi:dTDP-4-dehydrorhamnose reductase
LKLLVIGKNGQVGSGLLRALSPSHSITATDRTTLDLSRPEQIASVIQATQPEVIINAAAYTAVDKAESDQAAAQAINAVAPGVMADAARKIGALLVHYSTDYVYDGKNESPYTEDDVPAPLGVYGRTKLEGERAIQASGCRHVILRTEWVYGPYGGNFLLTMLRLAASRPELRVVDDQFGAPTSARMIAEATARILSAGVPQDSGLYLMTAAGQTTWCGFARAILSGSGSKVPVIAIPTKDYPTPAARPRNSVFDNSRFEKLFGFRLPAWEDGLRQCLQTLAEKPASA